MPNIFTEPVFEHPTVNHYVKVVIYYWGVIILSALYYVVSHNDYLHFWGLLLVVPFFTILGTYYIFSAFSSLLRIEFLTFSVAVLLLGIGHYLKTKWYGQVLALFGCLLWSYISANVLWSMY